MAQLIADCPRCGSKKITFDVNASQHFRTDHGWKSYHEAFCVCRHCDRSTVFVLAAREVDQGKLAIHNGLVGFPGTLNASFSLERFISLRDMALRQPPEHLPPEILNAFNEGVACLTIECANAAATMFRLCIDLATKPLLPAQDVSGLNSKIRRSLGLRLHWLFDNKLLPESLKDLAQCLKEDGNDGAHAGTLGHDDVEDLLDFSVLLLERLYTEPARLRLAETRRATRRAQTP